MRDEQMKTLRNCRNVANEVGVLCHQMIEKDSADGFGLDKLNVKLVDMILAISGLVEEGIISNEALESVVMGYSESLKTEADKKIEAHENQINTLFKNLAELADEVKKLKDIGLELTSDVDRLKDREFALSNDVASLQNDMDNVATLR